MADKKQFTDDEKANLPGNGDYRDWVLYMASQEHRNWTYSYYEYNNEFPKIKKGELARLQISLTELEEGGYAVKRKSFGIYDITPKGVALWDKGGFAAKETKEKEKENLEFELTKSTKDSISFSKITTIGSLIVAAGSLGVAYFSSEDSKETLLRQQELILKSQTQIENLQGQVEQTTSYQLQIETLKLEVQELTNKLDSTSP